MALLGAAGCTTPETEEADQSFGYDHQETVPASDADIIETIGDTGILFWSPEQQLAGYRNTPEVSPARILEPAPEPYPLPASETPIQTRSIMYGYDDGLKRFDDYMEEMNTVGALVIKDGEILLEEYRQGNQENTTWISFSVTKSVLSMMFGAALADGHIERLDEDITSYLPALSGTAYDGVQIEHLLHMSSGVRWDENYADENSDVARLERIHSEEALLEYLSRLPRVAEPGTRFNYNTAETNLAGAVLQAAVGKNLTEYAAESVWQGFGMEHGASWALMGEDAMEHGGCCISASLRDYGRIGMMALTNGEHAGSGGSVLADGWMERSVQPAESYGEYGYFWWLHGDSRFSATGIFGQHIHINPEENLVIALQSFWPEATGAAYSAHRRVFIDALTDAARSATADPEACCSEGNGD